MKRLVPIRMHVALGLVVTLVGMAVLTLATVNPSGLLAVFPALGGMALVTAACFVLAGSALWLPLSDAHQSGYRMAMGILLCLISSLVIIHFLDVIAEPFSGFIKPDANGFLWPGRVSLATAVSFLTVGLVLILLDSSSNSKKLVLLQFGLATIATIAIMAIFGHILGVDLFFSRLPEVSLMSFPTALTLLLLSIGLIGKFAESASFQIFYAGRDDLKVLVLSMLLLYCSILIAGMVGMGLLKMMDASDLYQPLRERLLVTLFILVALALLGVFLLFNCVYPIVRKLDFTKSQLTETLDNLPESVITINMQGIVQNASASTEALFGYTPAELIGRNIDLLIPESARKQHSGYFSGDLRNNAGRVLGAGPREMKALHRDGSEFPIEIAVSEFPFQGERLFIAIARDIRERKKAEESLGKWKRMFALAEWGIVVSEPNGTTLEEMNPAFARMHGYSVAELTGKNLLEVFAPQVRADIPAHIALAHERGHHRFESLHVHKDGHIFPVLIDVTIARSASGESLYRIANIQDISELKLTDKALRQSEALLNLILNSLPVGVLVADKDGNIVRVNPAGERIWMGKRLVGPEAYGQYIAWWADSGKPIAADEWALARAIRIGESFIDEVLEIQCFDGSRKFILNSAVPLCDPKGELQGAIVVNEDITARRQTEEEMRISKEFFQSVFDAAAIGMTICDITGRFLNINRTQCEIVGYSEQELLAMSYQDITHPDDLESNVDLMHELLAGRVPSFRVEKRYIRKDGRVVWVLLVVSLISDKHGRPLYLTGQMIDIDRQKRIENDLRASRASLANAQRIARIGDWEWDPADNTASWSEETFRIFGLQAERSEASPDAFFAIVHPDDRAKLQSALNTALSQHTLFSIDHRIVLPDGGERIVHSQAEVLFGPNGNPLRVVGTVQDVSERKQIELALLNSRQQLRAMSAYQEALIEEERKHIAREVHDELGQLLTGLKMDISLLRLRFGSDPALQQKAGEMRALVEKTINVVRHVASNLRPAALDHGIVPAIEWLAEDFSLRWEIPCAVSVQGEEVVLDDAHATVVFRVVQESLTNVARHAQASEVSISLRRGDQGLSLLVQDNGRGFDPAVVRRTQSFGLLGMRERVLALGGSLRIDSVPGQGTAVVIELPFHRDENP